MESNLFPSSPAQTGRVMQADTDHCNLSGPEVWGDLELLLPYGMAAKPPEGSQCVVLSLENGKRLNLGCPVSQQGLEPGEIKLQSRGGCYLILKNDGTIRLGGQVIQEEL